jgi:hypothetical protein
MGSRSLMNFLVILYIDCCKCGIETSPLSFWNKSCCSFWKPKKYSGWSRWPWCLAANSLMLDPCRFLMIRLEQLGNKQTCRLSGDSVWRRLPEIYMMKNLLIFICDIFCIYCFTIEKYMIYWGLLDIFGGTGMLQKL